MRKFVLVSLAPGMWLLFAALLVGMPGCFDSGGSTPEPLVSVQSALSAEDSATPAQTLSEEGNVVDHESKRVSYSWVDYKKGAAVTTSRLAFDVSNHTRRSATLQLLLHFNGFRNRTATVDLGQVVVDKGMSRRVAIDAASIPLKVIHGACQAHVQAIRIHEDPKIPPRALHYSKGLFYRFDESYSQVTVFDANTLVEQFGGRIWGTGDSRMAAGVELGRVVEASGAIKSINSRDDEFAIRSKDGKVLGYHTGGEMGFGEVDAAIEAAEAGGPDPEDGYASREEAENDRH